MTYDGGLSVNKMWKGQYEPEGYQPGFWDRLDAVMWAIFRVQILFWIISIVISIVSVVIAIFALKK